MHKAATWNINGVGFDVREAAREAARRQGKSLGEWLQGVIADHAAERGLAAGEVDEQDRIDAVTARLERLEAAARAKRSNKGRAGERVDASRSRVGAERQRESFSRSDEDADRFARRPRRESAATETLLDDAMEAMERRARRAERKTDQALADVARLVESTETKRDGEHDMVAALSRKLTDMEGRIAERVAGDNPIKVALARLEERLEAMGRRAPDPAPRASVPAADFSRPREDEPIVRLEAKLNSILEAVAAKPTPAAPAMATSALATARARSAASASGEAPVAPPAFANRRLGEAIAEIASHQRSLERRETDRRAPIPLPPRRAPQPALGGLGLDSLGGEIAGLAGKIEDMRREMASGLAAGASPLRPRDEASEQLDALLGEIAGLTRTMRDLAPRALPNQVAQMASSLDELRRDLARRDEQARRDERARQDERTRQEGLGRREDRRLAAVASRADLDDLRAEIGGLSKSLSQLAPRGSVTALEDAIRGLTGRMESAREDHAREALARRVRPEPAPVGQASSQLSSYDGQAYDGQLRQDQIREDQIREDQNREDRARETLMQPLEGVLDTLRDSLADMDPRGALADMEREVRSIGSKLHDMDGVDASVLARIGAQTEEIRTLVAAAAAHPLAVERIEQQVAGLARKLESGNGHALDRQSFHAATDEIRALVANPPGLALFDKVERRLEALTAKVDQAVDAASGARMIAELSKRRFDDVQEQIATRFADGVPLAEAGADLSSLEHLVRDLAARIETVRAPDASGAAIEALQGQIAQLSQRFERTDSELSTLSSIERSMHDLFAHLEDTRASVETTAARAAREAAKASLAQTGAADPAALREIAALKAIQEDADHRTHRTLNAVHETLERVVDRLSVMETEVASARSHSGPPAARPTVPRADPLPDLLLDPADARERPAPPRAPTPERSRAASFDSARPAPTDLDETAGRADFIAAARRAARTAQTDPAVMAMVAGEPARAPGDVRAGLMAKSRDYVASHKKPVLLSIAALFVILGTLAVMGSLKGDGEIKLAARSTPPRPTVLAAATPSRVPEKAGAATIDPAASVPAARPLAADLTPSALLKAPAPASAALPGSDPITTASIPRLPSFAAQALASAAPVAPSGALKQLADEGDASAQYEVASRYAEGRQLIKNFKLAADWYEKAAQQGLAPAQYRLGALYEKGLGVSKDKEKAKYWYIKASDAGNPRAMHNLAVMMADGDGKPDYASAVIWFRKAAEYGVHDSQYNLAILLARGLGTPQSLVQSYQWFAVAAQMNDTDAATKRDQVGAKLSPSDLAVAKTLASTFHPKTANVAAVQIEPPASGWDGASQPSSLKSTRAKLSSL